MMIFPFLLLLFFGMGSTVALVLPSGFKLQPTEQGFDLTWSSESVKVTKGASRYEFRLEDGTVFGYPREIQNELRLPLTSSSHTTLYSQGATLEVWWGSKRIDANAPLRTAPMPGISADAPVVSTPTVDINPAQLGSFTTRRDSYNLGSLTLEEFPIPVEVMAEVTDPPQATGRRPLILFLHGRHDTCYKGGPNGDSLGEWPCPEDFLPVPSHQGFRYIADILASQGYIVVSISANGINGQDGPSFDVGSSSRSILIRYHLSLWAEWNANGGSPWGDRFKGRLNMNQVVLVGHSRAGEAVHRAAIDALPSDPYKIVGVFAFGPTAYNTQVTPDVHSATILPTCDGDISNLEGQLYVDTSRDIAYSEALRSAVISVGSNHNFFNTEWTPGLAVAPAFDDWEYDVKNSPDDPVCGSQGGGLRLTPQEQQVVGATYTVAFVKMAVNQDVAMLPLLDGTYVRPAIIGRAEVATHTVGGAKYRLLYRVQDAGRPALRNGMTGQECVGFPKQVITSKLPLCSNDNEFLAPHWFSYSQRPSSYAMELKWTNRLGAIAQFTVPSGLRNLATLDSLDVRIANDPEKSGVRFDLVVADQSGRNATLSTNLTTIDGWQPQYRIHARTLRGSLASVRTKVNLGNIVYVFLVARSATGRVWVLDIAASQARIQTPIVLDLPKLSIDHVEFVETDGFKRYSLNIIAERPLTTNAAVWVQPGIQRGTGYQLNLVPSGSSTVVGQILYDFVGDNIFSGHVFKGFYLEAVKGIVTGDYFGSITILEDEIPPKVSVKASNVTAPEGRSLKWTFKLSAPTAGLFFSFIAVKPSKGKELTSRDVPDSWLDSLGIFPIPTTPVPFSELGLSFGVYFRYGMRSVDLLIPLAYDGVAEGNEIVVLKQQYNDFGELPTLIGNVVDNS